jgi:tRNA(Arg) A34 adenosine deaminase TadA
MMHQRFLERAIEIGRQAMVQGTGGPFGAVVARGEELIAEGSNRVTSAHDPTAHAEVVAIREACRKLGTHSLDGCQLYASCEPCPMCLGALYWARVDALYFAASRGDAEAIGFDDARFYEEIQRGLAARTLPTRQALREEARAMMQGWLTVDPSRRY